jgi:hypothetical protein
MLIMPTVNGGKVVIAVIIEVRGHWNVKYRFDAMRVTLRASDGTLSPPRLHLQSLAPTNPHWARVVGYGSFSFCVIHKEGSVDIPQQWGHS